MFKTLSTVCLLALLVPMARATSTLPFYESFPTNYAEGSALTDSPASTVWGSGNGAGAGAVTVASAAALSSATGLLTSNGSRGLVLKGTPSSNRDRGAAFTSQTLGAINPTVYVSFLFNVQVPATTNRLLAYLRDDTSQGTPHAGLFLDASNRLSVSKNSLTPAASTTGALVNNQTYLVVLRYKWISATTGDDEVALWLNPGDLGVAEGLVPTPAIATTSGNDFETMASFMVGNRSAGGAGTASGTQWMDEVRIGTSWASVTPTDGPSAPTPVPVITYAQLLPQGVVLRGTNGPNNGIYQVLGTTNVALPLTNWPPIATHNFDAAGNFDSTNPVAPGLPQQFFRLLVGGTLPPAPTAPNITNQPQNLAIAIGQTANFLVGAGGTVPLTYFWSFNTNTPVGGDNSTLALLNVQTNDAGSYRVIVSNSVGTATSSVATLTVIAAPSITAQPQSQSVTVSNNATFTVMATGAQPLTYQWRFNTNTPVGGNSNVFTLLSAQTNNAGAYSVIVTNNYGATTSSVATLTVNPWSAAPDFSLVGFAALDGFASNGTLQAGGTTGGAGGPLVIASNLASFKAYLESTDVYRVLVVSNIDLSSLSNHSGGFPADYPTGEILVRSHKTIYSTNGATISRGTLRMGKASLGPQQNIIIKNLKFRDLWVYDPSGNYDGYGWDYVRLEEGSHHVWVDHCDFDKVYDGMIDVVHGSDYVTASWNIFRTQKKCSLIGHSNSNQAEDNGHLNVTYHHNYFVDVEERLPRMRFGNAHVFNTYCENLGGNGIQSTCEAATLVENSHFQFPQSGSLPTREENGSASSLPNNGTGVVKVVSCVISNLPGVNVQFRQFGQATFKFNAPFTNAIPPYSYTNVMHPVSQVPNIVTNWSGVGKLTSF